MHTLLAAVYNGVGNSNARSTSGRHTLTNALPVKKIVENTSVPILPVDAEADHLPVGGTVNDANGEVASLQVTTTADLQDLSAVGVETGGANLRCCTQGHDQCRVDGRRTIARDAEDERTCLQLLDGERLVERDAAPRIHRPWE